MRSRLSLTAIRLVNWHNFTDETIPVDGALFLVGDNGVGKTTLLDAIHLALTGALGVELNAAARVRGRRGEGRDLAGILLRHDLERGHLRPEGAVGYALLELRGEKNVLTVGLGAFVASPEARPERWGIITSLPLSEVKLLEGSEGGERVLDRAELAQRLPPGSVMDIGRYRTRLGERIFGSRASFEQVSHFLAAGKAYRDLVAATENFGGLFASLLPDPDAGAFHEIQRALEAMERTRTDLAALDQELGQLRTLIGLLAEIDGQHEALARYAYLEATHQAKSCETEEARAQAAGEASGRVRGEVERKLRALRTTEATVGAEEEKLRASEGVALLDRRREFASASEAEQASLASASSELESLARESKASTAEALAARAQIEKIAAAGSRHVAKVRQGAAPHLRPDGLDALGRLGDHFAQLERQPDRTLPEELEPLRQRALRELERAAATAGAEARTHRDLARAAEEASAETRKARAALEHRGEPPPPLFEIDAAITALAEARIPALPLYRALEPTEATSLDRTGLLERALGHRRLSTLLVAPPHHPAALALILDRFPGVPLAEPGQEKTAGIELPAGSAAAELRVALEGEAACVARAFLAHHLGGLRSRALLVAAGASTSAEFSPSGAGVRAASPASLDPEGHLHEARIDERLPAGPPRWLGAEARAHALALEVEALETSTEAHTRRAAKARDAASTRETLERTLQEVAETLGAIDLQGLVATAERRRSAQLQIETLRGRLARATERRDEARARTEATAEALATLDRAVRAAGVEALAERLRTLVVRRQKTREQIEAAMKGLGRAEVDEKTAAARLEAVSTARARNSEALAKARTALLARVDPTHRADLDAYVLVQKQGRQIKVANLPARAEQARRQIAALEERIAGSDGLRHPILWQKYGFRHDAGEGNIEDSSGAALPELTARLQEEVDGLQAALGEGRDELLERIVLEDLVSTLRGEVFGLESTIAEVNGLVADLTFGTTRYRIRAALRPEMRRPYQLLKESSAISPAKTAELKDYFASRLDELTADQDELPALLDYRQWFDFGLELFRMGEGGVVLSREKMRQGSGGEQAVPSYLLLFCLTRLLYQRVDASVCLLLLDEAFYGIDAGRREELLRFCTRAGIDLIVATPELDGVSEALDRSTTLLVEKTPEGDVFLHDYRFARRPETLFAKALSDTEEAVIGVNSGAATGAKTNA